MNPIALGMDGLLAGLLLLAVVVGVRLNGRLKALRESHQGFAKAVAELDAAATKADKALKALHQSSEQTHDELLARIETARSLLLRLEKAGEAAEKSAAKAESAAARRPEPLLTPPPPAAPRRAALSDLLATYETRSGETRAGETRAGAPSATRATPASDPTPRRRPVADEDLFAQAQAGVRPGLAGLMRMSLGKTAR
jgi:hypothetical protein